MAIDWGSPEYSELIKRIRPTYEQAYIPGRRSLKLMERARGLGSKSGVMLGPMGEMESRLSGDIGRAETGVMGQAVGRAWQERQRKEGQKFSSGMMEKQMKWQEDMYNKQLAFEEEQAKRQEGNIIPQLLSSVLGMFLGPLAGGTGARLAGAIGGLKGGFGGSMKQYLTNMFGGGQNPLQQMIAKMFMQQPQTGGYNFMPNYLGGEDIGFTPDYSWGGINPRSRTSIMYQ